MQYSEWHRYDYRQGRQFYNHKDIYVKYDEQELIKDRICEIIKEFLRVESAVRITTDTKLCEDERLIMAVPYEAPTEKIIRNFSLMIYTSLLSYYFAGNHKTEHFGISNEVLEGRLNSFIIREIEFIFNQIKNRNDISGRLLRDANFAKTVAKKTGDNYMRSTLIQGLDITLGYRIIIFGNKVNGGSLFIPVPDGADVIEQIYYNMEHIIHHNFVTYDETNTRDHLKVTDTLIFKELVQIMNRAKLKENVRKKILNNTRFPTILTDDNKALYGELAGDLVYDTINHADDPVIREASDRSKELFNTFMIRATEITSSTLDFSKVKMSTTGSTYVPADSEDVEGGSRSSDNDGDKTKVSASASSSSSKSKSTDSSKAKSAPVATDDDLIEL